jgi:hypothetical protein
MKTFFLFFITWLIFATAGGVVGYCVFSSPRIDRLVEKGVPIYGKVISKERENHGNLNYSYVVDDKEYFGNGGAGGGNPRFDDIQIGQQFIVYYDSEVPEKSIAGYPQLHQEAHNGGIVFCIIMFPLFPMAILTAIYLGICYSRKQA